MLPSPLATPSVPILKSVNAIPEPPPPVESAAGAHSDPSHFKTCPVLGAVELTFVKSPRAVAPPPDCATHA